MGIKKIITLLTIGMIGTFINCYAYANEGVNKINELSKNDNIKNIVKNLIEDKSSNSNKDVEKNDIESKTISKEKSLDKDNTNDNFKSSHKNEKSTLRNNNEKYINDYIWELSKRPRNFYCKIIQDEITIEDGFYKFECSPLKEIKGIRSINVVLNEDKYNLRQSVSLEGTLVDMEVFWKTKYDFLVDTAQFEVNNFNYINY